MELVFRPIGEWPGQLTQSRKKAPFRASYGNTLRLLDEELRHLGAREVFLQVALRTEDIRLDGRPRADAKPMTHPGVILTFDSRYGPLQYPCDRFLAWEDNLRAIALSLQCLRAVNRYGVTRIGEQYRGWQQLPDKSSGPSREAAAAFLSRFAANGKKPSTREEIDAAYREGCRQLHPDRGGSEEWFKDLIEAHETLTRSI